MDQQQDPFANNPLFQAALGHAQQAAVDATMRGQDPYQAALQAAQAGVRQAAQPRVGADGQPASPGDGNLVKIQQFLQAKGEPPDRALALAHQIMPRLGGGGGG